MKQLYLSNVRYADAHLGKIMALHADHDRWQNTLFTVIGDHGEAFNEHGFLFHNDTVYNEMIRIPAVFSPSVISEKFHGKVAGETVSAHLSHLLQKMAGIPSRQQIDFPVIRSQGIGPRAAAITMRRSISTKRNSRKSRRR